MRTLVVLPTYNESATIERILQRVRAALPEADVLVVDDSSPDGTAKTADAAATELGQIFVLVRPNKEGLGPAYRAGFRWGLERGYEVFVEMDSDFSHDPDALPDLVAPLALGYHVSIGSRYVPGGHIPNWTFSRKLLSRGGNLYAKYLLGLGVEDSTAGFRAYSASALEAIDLDSVRANGYGFQVEMTYRAIRAGAAIVEVPISFTDRVEGTSKMSFYTVAEALLLVSVWAAERVFQKRRRPAGSLTASRPSRGEPAV